MLFFERNIEAPEMTSRVVKSLTVMVCACALNRPARASKAHKNIRFIV